MQPTFGQLLAEGMRRKGLDYRTLGKLVGVSHGYLWQIVNAEKRALNDPAAKRKRPSEAVTRQLAAALALDESTLLAAAGYAEAERNPLESSPVRYTAFSPPAEDLYRDGLDASAKGQPDRAVALLQAALERGGVSFVNAHAGLGMAHFQAGRYEQAIAEYDAALEALEAQSEPASIGSSDLYYNRGLAFQRRARAASAEAARALRLAARRDFRRAIRLGGESQDLYHSALCYLLLESGQPKRVIPIGRAFLSQQALAPRYTTAALDISLFLAYAHSAVGDGPMALSLADMTLQLCPSYWFAHYVKAALLAQQTARSARRQEACFRLGLSHAERALALNPGSRSHFQGELAGDFRAWQARPQFAALLALPTEA